MLRWLGHQLLPPSPTLPHKGGGSAPFVWHRYASTSPEQALVGGSEFRIVLAASPKCGLLNPVNLPDGRSSSSPVPVAGPAGNAYVYRHEPAVIQNTGLRLRRSRPWDGCDRVGPSQETEHTASDGVRWNADHHAGHGLSATARPRGAGGAEAANPAPGTPPRHHARQQ